MPDAHIHPDHPGEQSTTRSGLDRFLGPTGMARSKMPPNLVDGVAETDTEMGTEVDCTGKDADQAVCRIKDVLEKRDDPTA